MELTPLVAPDSQIVNSAFEGGFRISNKLYQGPIVILSNRVMAWSGDLSPPFLSVLDKEDCEILLVGLDPFSLAVDHQFRTCVKKRGSALDLMPTRAACHTHNILLTEGRKVVSALQPLKPKQV